MPPSLDIVIVNWNAGGLLQRCVASIGSALTGGFRLDRLVVVDNASTDGSADNLLADGLPAPSTCWQLSEARARLGAKRPVLIW